MPKQRSSHSMYLHDVRFVEYDHIYRKLWHKFL